MESLEEDLDLGLEFPSEPLKVSFDLIDAVMKEAASMSPVFSSKAFDSGSLGPFAKDAYTAALKSHSQVCDGEMLDVTSFGEGYHHFMCSKCSFLLLESPDS